MNRRTFCASFWALSFSPAAVAMAARRPSSLPSRWLRLPWVETDPEGVFTPALAPPATILAVRAGCCRSAALIARLDRAFSELLAAYPAPSPERVRQARFFLLDAEGQRRFADIDGRLRRERELAHRWQVGERPAFIFLELAGYNFISHLARSVRMRRLEELAGDAQIIRVFSARSSRHT